MKPVFQKEFFICQIYLISLHNYLRGMSFQEETASVAYLHKNWEREYLYNNCKQMVFSKLLYRYLYIFVPTSRVYNSSFDTCPCLIPLWEVVFNCFYHQYRSPLPVVSTDLHPRSPIHLPLSCLPTTSRQSTIFFHIIIIPAQIIAISEQ